MLAQIKAAGTPLDVLPSLLPFGDFLDFIGIAEIRELEQRFADGDDAEGDARSNIQTGPERKSR